MASIRVGTSGFSYADWIPAFYPPGTRPGDFLACYAGRFDMVEVDSTFYRTPAPRTVQGWYDRTPDHFRFAVKVPGVITHENVLLDCDMERDAFLAALAPLRHKLHCVLLQFGYFNRKAFATPISFFQRLDTFLAAFPDVRRLAVEIRNRTWLTDELFEVLRRHGAAFVLTEHAWMPPVERVIARHDCLTGDFVYLRLIGDRAAIEKTTTQWDKVVIDRSDRMRAIARALARHLPGADIVAFINNHFAGHAPASCEAFLNALDEAARETQA